ncbi:MAG: DUF4145 domain-containing protein [Dehalococcoidales bacterium]|nr:DUF4145 domain-containing protein [Dehalococcoidales bacterium]
MTKTSISNAKPKYIFCNKCKCETEHTCKGEHFRDYPNYDDFDGSLIFVERAGYRLRVCSGCKTGLLEEYYIVDVNSDNLNDESSWDFTYHPPRNEFQINSKEFKQLKDKLSNIYRETLGAYNNKLNILCALSIRSLLEGICSDKKIAGQNLQQKIDNMTTILPKNIVSNLHSIRFIGNEAAHELSAPSTEDLRLAIELCEDLLNFLYELDYKARTLTASRRSRKNKQKAKTVRSS